MSSNWFQNSYLQPIRLQILYKNKKNSELNNPQGLICHKIPTNQPSVFYTKMNNLYKIKHMKKSVIFINIYLRA